MQLSIVTVGVHSISVEQCKVLKHSSRLWLDAGHKPLLTEVSHFVHLSWWMQCYTLLLMENTIFRQGEKISPPYCAKNDASMKSACKSIGRARGKTFSRKPMLSKLRRKAVPSFPRPPDFNGLNFYGVLHLFCEKSLASDNTSVSTWSNQRAIFGVYLNF